MITGEIKDKLASTINAKGWFPQDWLALREAIEVLPVDGLMYMGYDKLRTSIDRVLFEYATVAAGTKTVLVSGVL